MTRPRFLAPIAPLAPWAAALAGSLVLGLVGCSSSSSADDGGAETAGAGAATEVAIESPAGAGPAVSNGDPRLADARAAEAAGDLQQAYQLYANAVNADPGSAEAKASFQRVGAVLGLREHATDEVAAAAEEMTEVRRAQVRIEAESKVQQGEAALNAGEFDAAIQSFEAALTIVHWNPFLVGGTLTEESLEARIESAKRARSEAARAAEQDRQARILREKAEAEAQERARLENQVVTLFDASNKACQDDRFAEAEGYLDEILRIDPANEDARRLKKIVRDAGRQANDRALRQSYKQNWRETFDEITENLRPQGDLITFPDEKTWREISERGPNQFAVQSSQETADEREINAKLKGATVTLNFTETPLAEAVEFLKTATGVNFLISPTVLESGEEPTFSVTTGAMAGDAALQLLLDVSSPPLSYRIQNGVVKIVGKDEAVGGQTLEIYDIRDLAKVISNFPSKDFNLTPSNYSPEEPADGGPEPAPLVLEGDKLAELIKANIAPESWDADPGNTIQAVSGTLVVRHSRKVHELINALLHDLRENAGTLVNIESRFLTVSDSFLEDIGVDFRGLGPDSVNPQAVIPPGLTLDDFGSIPEGFGTPSVPSGIGTDNDLGIFDDNGGDGDVKARVENLYDVTLGNDQFTNSGGLSLQATFLDDTLVEAVLRAVSKYGTTNIVDAPSLTLFNGQRANLSVINHVSYVKDFDVEIAQAAVIAQPIVGIIEEGVILDVRPVVSSDKRFVTMELRPSVAILKRPIDTFTTSLGIGSTVSIELPVLRIKRARTTVTMPDGSTLMIGGWKLAEEQDYATGVPFLNKIPLVNFLFDRKGTFLNKSKLIVLVRAKILVPPEHEPITGLSR